MNWIYDQKQMCHISTSNMLCPILFVQCVTMSFHKMQFHSNTTSSDKILKYFWNTEIPKNICNFECLIEFSWISCFFLYEWIEGRNFFFVLPTFVVNIWDTRCLYSWIRFIYQKICGWHSREKIWIFNGYLFFTAQSSCYVTLNLSNYVYCNTWSMYVLHSPNRKKLHFRLFMSFRS